MRSVAGRLSAAGQPPCSHGLRGAAVADAVELAPPPDLTLAVGEDSVAQLPEYQLQAASNAGTAHMHHVGVVGSSRPSRAPAQQGWKLRVSHSSRAAQRSGAAEMTTSA